MSFLKQHYFSQEKFVILFLSAFLLFNVLLAYYSNGTYESGDSIQHYLIARYSFIHPQLFLDHWGKPIFTLLASPFAQFGFFGICLFNILCATITGFVAYRTATHLKINYAFLAPIFILFIPIYFVTLISGLTEPLFALVLLAGVYFLIRQKITFASIIVSLLPFIRTEGFLLLPLFAVAFIIQRKYVQCLLLLTGSIVYSIGGFFYYHTFFWIWTENPYTGAKEIYGSGDLFHFISKNEFILGLPIVCLFLLGIIGCIMQRTKHSISELILIPGIFFSYLFAHSIFWWKGLYGSLGLIRVMAAVTPLAGLIALRGLNLITNFFTKKIPLHYLKINALITILIVLLICWMPFKQHTFPRSLGYEDEVVKQAADWIKQNQSTASNYSYQYPYFSVFLNIDPFNNYQYIPLWSFKLEKSARGSIIIWDNHYGLNEAKMPLNTLTGNPSFELLATFKGDPAKTPSDKELFELYVFKVK